MLSIGLIRLTGHGADKHYAILAKGKDELNSFNYLRYPRCLFADNNTLLRAPARAMANGDAAVMLYRAGYSVHPHDKPELPSHTHISDDNADRRQIYRNSLEYRYDNSEDSTIYIKRHTPINCYYTSVEIKRYFEQKNNNGLRYSRACGVLLTPDNILRIFHSRDVALEFKSTGENKLTSLLPKLFSGYLPPRRQGLFVFGNGFLSAKKILATEFSPERIRMAKVSNKTCLGTKNLGNPLFYLPVIPDSIPLLRLFQYPGWEGSVSSFMAKQLYGSFKERQDVFYADGDDGSALFIGLTLNLTAVAGLIRAVRDKPRSVSLICLNWQKEFYRETLDNYAGDGAEHVHIYSVSNDAISVIDTQLYEYWG